jgi:demethylmenaquinone methyltransferase/2-methoxy-6-polyprenyl-1,4-benzoquinol methylase
VKLRQALARPETKREYNQRLFATIAARYDLITRLLSFGRDQAWKNRVVALAGVTPADDVLDLACGTGDLAARSAAAGARVVGLDLTPRMLELAAQRCTGARVHWCTGDICSLPIRDTSFSVVTVGYGLRNVPDLKMALAEIHRVLKPGGRLVALDFDKPEAAWLRGIYLGYLHVAGGALGWALHRDPDTYRYIPASIRRYPGARGVVKLMEAAGFVKVRHVRVFGGLMAIHLAEKRLFQNSSQLGQ